MLDRFKIKQMLDEWTQYFETTLKEMIPREIRIQIPKKNALGLTGVRRGGKSWTAIEQARAYTNHTLYINFEDPLFISDSDIFNLQEMISVYHEHKGQNPKLVIFDEIQNIPGWEKWVRKTIDMHPFQLIITGSNATLLSSELSTAISGRCIEERIWPLSYKEFIQFKKANPTSTNQHRHLFREFLKWGAFPEVVLEEDSIQKRKLLLQYAQDLVHRDIINRYEIRNKRALDQIRVYYANNVSKLHSYQALKKAFQITADLAAQYTSHLSDAFYCFEVFRFHKNMKVQIRDPKKIYLIDSGMRNILAPLQEQDFGKLLENIVFIELKRRGCEVAYFKEEKECDFIVTQHGEPLEAIQVTYSDLSQEHHKELLEREINGLLEAMTKLNLKDGTLINLSRKEAQKIGNKTINFIPIFEWLLHP